MSNVHSTLFAGPLGQLIDMGGPVMVVLLAMAVLGQPWPEKTKQGSCCIWRSS